MVLSFEVPQFDLVDSLLSAFDADGFEEVDFGIEASDGVNEFAHGISGYGEYGGLVFHLVEGVAVGEVVRMREGYDDGF